MKLEEVCNKHNVRITNPVDQMQNLDVKTSGLVKEEVQTDVQQQK